MSEELKKNLQNVTDQLQQIANNKAACDQLVGTAKKITIADSTEEVENPISLTLTGDIVKAVIAPIVDVLNKRREQLINIKEQILAQLEAELNPPAADQPPADPNAPVVPTPDQPNTAAKK